MGIEAKKIAQSSEGISGYGFPHVRLRRMRAHAWSRDLIAEHHLAVSDMILPLFVQNQHDENEPVSSMPGVVRHTIASVVSEAKKAAEMGIPALAVFPVVDSAKKTSLAEESYNPNNLICQAVEAIKSSIDNIGIICDVALDPYTTHGQDGLVQDGVVLNDQTIDVLCQQAVVQAMAGCDVIAPSDMMDGRIGAIRQALDTEGFEHVAILSYAAKYASGFYGPFRSAVGSADCLGHADKRTYQMSPHNSDEAMREISLDVAEGADIVMVKPGMPYLDIIRRARDSFNIPVFAYQVSGEYAMLKAAAQQGWLDDEQVMYESLIAFKRAGATGILTYAAMDMAQHLLR